MSQDEEIPDEGLVSPDGLQAIRTSLRSKCTIGQLAEEWYTANSIGTGVQVASGNKYYIGDRLFCNQTDFKKLYKCTPVQYVAQAAAEAEFRRASPIGAVPTGVGGSGAAHGSRLLPQDLRPALAEGTSNSSSRGRVGRTEVQVAVPVSDDTSSQEGSAPVEVVRAVPQVPLVGDRRSAPTRKVLGYADPAVAVARALPNRRAEKVATKAAAVACTEPQAGINAEVKPSKPGGAAPVRASKSGVESRDNAKEYQFGDVRQVDGVTLVYQGPESGGWCSPQEHFDRHDQVVRGYFLSADTGFIEKAGGVSKQSPPDEVSPVATSVVDNPKVGDVRVGDTGVEAYAGDVSKWVDLQECYQQTGIVPNGCSVDESTGQVKLPDTGTVCLRDGEWQAYVGAWGGWVSFLQYYGLTDQAPRGFRYDVATKEFVPKEGVAVGVAGGSSASLKAAPVPPDVPPVDGTSSFPVLHVWHADVVRLLHLLKLTLVGVFQRGHRAIVVSHHLLRASQRFVSAPNVSSIKGCPSHSGSSSRAGSIPLDTLTGKTCLTGQSGCPWRSSV
jgi:hypothetical protein